MKPKWKIPPGSQSEYKPEFVDMIVSWGREGNTPSTFGTLVNASPATITKWKKAHPEFAESWELCKLYRKKFLEDLATKQAVGNEDGRVDGAPNMTMFLLKTGFRDEYGDSIQQNIKSDGNISIEFLEVPDREEDEADDN